MSTNPSDLASFLKNAAAEARSKPPMLAIFIDEDHGNAVEIFLDTKVVYYSEHIKGEGADISLYRDMETHKVVGCRLPHYLTDVIVSRIKADGEYEVLYESVEPLGDGK